MCVGWRSSTAVAIVRASSPTRRDSAARPSADSVSISQAEVIAKLAAASLSLRRPSMLR